jgi:hypothetical protein
MPNAAVVADQARDHIVANEIDFSGALRLRIGKQNYVEFLRLVDFPKREVE